MRLSPVKVNYVTVHGSKAEVSILPDKTRSYSKHSRSLNNADTQENGPAVALASSHSTSTLELWLYQQHYNLKTSLHPVCRASPPQDTRQLSTNHSTALWCSTNQIPAGTLLLTLKIVWHPYKCTVLQSQRTILCLVQSEGTDLVTWYSGERIALSLIYLHIVFVSSWHSGDIIVMSTIFVLFPPSPWEK